MLRWFRACARSTAAAVLVSLVALGGLSTSSHHDHCHDEDCFSLLFHDPDGHAWQRDSGSPDQFAQHCILCHMARSFRPRAVASSTGAPSIQAGVRIHVVAVALPAIAPASQPPLRAPPVAPAVVL